MFEKWSTLFTHFPRGHAEPQVVMCRGVRGLLAFVGVGWAHGGGYEVGCGSGGVPPAVVDRRPLNAPLQVEEWSPHPLPSHSPQLFWSGVS